VSRRTDQTSDAGAEMVVEAEVGRMVDSRGTRGVVGPFGGGHVEVAVLILDIEGYPVGYNSLTPINVASVAAVNLYWF
jgi:hypothetical protein